MSESQETDLLGRTSFATMVAEAILAAPSSNSAVFALCGDWGTGKTWTARQIVKTIGDRAKVLEFEPWMVSTPEALAREFFLDLARGALGNGNDSDAVAKRERYWRYAAQVLEVTGNIASPLATLGVPGAGLLSEVSKRAQSPIKAAAEGLKALSEKPSLREARDNLIKELGDSEPPIVMVIDDVDRLTDEEIRTLFRLIKACADFPNVKYLLLFQQAQVERALSPITDDGNQYLEKIVTVNINLPSIRNEDRRRVLENLLGPILCKASDDDSKKRVAELLESVLMPGLPTLRSVERYAASAIALERGLQSKEGVSYDPADFLALEFLRVKFPKIYAEVVAPRQARRNFFEEYLAKEKGEKPEWAVRMAEILAGEDDDRVLAERAFEALRPDLDLNSGRSKDLYRPLQGWGRRFFLEAWRPVYLGLSSAHAALGEAEWFTFKQQLESDGPTIDMPSGLFDEDKRPKTIFAIRDRIIELSEKALRRFLQVLMEWGEADSIQSGMMTGGSALTIEDLAGIAESILAELDIKRVALPALKESVEKTGAIVLPATIVASEFAVQERSLQGYWSDKNDLTEYAEFWRVRLSTMQADRSLYSHPKARSLWLALNKLESEENWKAMTDRVFADPEDLVLYIEALWSIPTTDQLFTGMNFASEERDAILAVDPKLLGPRGLAIQQAYQTAREQYELAERLMRRRRRW